MSNMRPMRLMKPILPIILFFILLSAAVFLLRSKPDSQTPATLQLNQSNTTAGTSSQTSDVSPSTSDVDFAAIQGPQKPPPLKIQQIAPVKYAIRSLKQDVIEIGTERHSPPKPYLKLNKWEGEATLKVSIPYNTSETPEEIDGKLRCTGDGVKVDFYPKAPQEITEKDSKGNEHKYTINEEGGVEFDTILDTKPADNKIVFPIETQGLKFYYQPPLTQKEIDEGAFRPENVVGSYAVYHESKQGDYSKMGGKNYMAGKAFHIYRYRPKIIDASGKEIWGELNIEEQAGTLTITIPQDWLDNAVYPVTIDPNFGYETKGGTELGIGAGIRAFLATGAAGTVNSVTAYYKQFSIDTPKIKHALYTRTGTYTGSYLTNSGTEEWTLTASWNNWKTLNIASPL